MCRRWPRHGDGRGATQLSETASGGAGTTPQLGEHRPIEPSEPRPNEPSEHRPNEPSEHRPIEIVPSVLPADFARLGKECEALTRAGVDRIQWDVMDGVFVPNLTFGPDVIAACRTHSNVPFEAHLMVVEPDELLDRYVQAGCGIVIVHAEACTRLAHTLAKIAELGAVPAVALNPATPVDAILGVLDLVGMVLVMTVNPGFGGQSYIAAGEPKVAALRNAIVTGGYDVDIEVDGGISASTVGGAAEAGANVLVSGSALFAHSHGLGAAVSELRELAQAAQLAGH